MSEKKIPAKTTTALNEIRKTNACKAIAKMKSASQLIDSQWSIIVIK